MMTKINIALITLVVASIFLSLGYYWGWRQHELSTKTPANLIIRETSNPLFQERTASIPDATIVSINNNNVELRDFKNNKDTFPLSPNARVINLSKTGAGSTPSADLSKIQPGQHAQVILRFVDNKYRVEQFFLDK